MLLQSKVSYATTYEERMGLLDDEDEPQSNIEARDEDPAFYVGICLDFIVILIIVHTMRLWRNSRRTRSSPQSAAEMSECSDESKTVSVLTLHAALREVDVAKCTTILDRAGRRNAKKMINNAEVDVWGCTALHVAAHACSEELIGMLMDRGANITALDSWDQSPLHFAAVAGSMAGCRMLLDRGAAINPVDSQDKTPLHLAGQHGHKEVCELLLKRGGALCSSSDADIPPVLGALFFERMFEVPLVHE